MNNILNIILISILCLLTSNVRADQDWYWKARGQVILRDFSSSLQYDNLTGFGAYLAGDYLERASFTIGATYNHTNYNAGLNNSFEEIDENILFLSASGHFHPGLLPGRLTLRLDGYVGKDEFGDVTITTPGPGGGTTETVTIEDDFSVFNPSIAFLNHKKTFYVDLGYARSEYKSDDSLLLGINITQPGMGTVAGSGSSDNIKITQWTPTVGFGFNHTDDWLQLRAYLISFSPSNRVAFKDSTAALEAKWTRWFSSDTPLGLHNAGISMIVGERIYAVDSDAYSLYNIADMQKGSIALNAEWKLNEQLALLLQGSYEKYDDIVLDHSYDSTYIYVQLEHSW